VEEVGGDCFSIGMLVDLGNSVGTIVVVESWSICEVDLSILVWCGESCLFSQISFHRH
jgi:hypothetical protein